MPQKFETLVKKIVKEANALKNRHTKEKDARVNYSAIFTQKMSDYYRLANEMGKVGGVLSENDAGIMFHVPVIKTVAGPLKIVKVRKPEIYHTELGDADFTVKNYRIFRSRVNRKPGFRLMRIENYEMIELVDPKFNARAYFSNKPVDEELGI